MARPETICPNCGHSPIREGAEICPRCRKPFAFELVHERIQRAKPGDTIDGDTTTFGGGVTDAVTAHPMPPAAVFALGAVAWFLRAGGVLGEAEEPAWLYSLVAVNLVVPMMLIINLGPARVVAQLVGLAELAVAVLLAEGDFLNLLHAGFIALPAVILFMTTAEPGPARRNVGLALGVVATGVAVAGMLLGAKTPRLGEVEIVSRAQGFSLRVPEGYRALGREEMLPHLHLPLAGGTARSFGFGNKAKRIYGALTFDRGAALIGGCQELLRSLGGVQEGAPVSSSAPRALGQPALVLELRTASGAVGRLACGKLADGRLAALAVVAQDPDPHVGATIFEQVGASLSIDEAKE